jgi:hypothetical protein
MKPAPFSHRGDTYLCDCQICRGSSFITKFDADGRTILRPCPFADKMVRP